MTGNRGDQGATKWDIFARSSGSLWPSFSSSSRWRTGIPLPSASGRGRISKRNRSEEHTSELQSLMRISYAVFGLNKKKTKTHTTATTIKHKHITKKHNTNY